MYINNVVCNAFGQSTQLEGSFVCDAVACVLLQWLYMTDKTASCKFG